MATDTSQKNQRKINTIISLLLIVVLTLGVKAILDYRSKSTLEKELSQSQIKLDSTYARLEKVSYDLEMKIQEVEKLGGDVSDLRQAKEEVENELKTTRTRTAESLQKLQSRIDGYRTLLNNKDKEIRKLKSVNKQLFSEVTTLKTSRNQLSDSITELSEQTKNLAGKVAVASQLQAENLQVKAVNHRGKERSSPFRSKHASKLKVVFNLAENKITEQGSHTLFLCIKDANGQPIFDLEKESGSFLVDDKEQFYATSKDILFDNSGQQVEFIYDKGSSYASGRYQAEIYTNNYLVGSVPFTIK